ncbi:hypothetical protein GGI12_001106 [Dipsacomyces acuminosporus]|nr:hypothetical protein GGI12_001106 [Dipsacomyces acuminosporus]
MKTLLGIATIISIIQTTNAAKGCDAQNVLNNCLQVQGIVFSGCAYSDWTCKCQAQQALVACYNNCPGDTNKAGQEGQAVVFCDAAKRVSDQEKSSATSSSSSASAQSSLATKSTSQDKSKETHSAATATKPDKEDHGSNNDDSARWKKGTAFAGKKGENSSAKHPNAEDMTGSSTAPAGPSAAALAALGLGLASWMILTIY